MQESYGATGDGLGAVEHDSAAPATAAGHDGMDDELGAPYNGEPLHSTHMQMHDRQFDDRLLRTVRARAIRRANPAQFSVCNYASHAPPLDRCPRAASRRPTAPSRPARPSPPPTATLSSRCLPTSRRAAKAAARRRASRRRASRRGSRQRGRRRARRAGARSRSLPRATARRSAAGSPRAAGSPVARDARPARPPSFLPHPYISELLPLPFLPPHALPTHLSSLHTSWCA